MILLICVRPKSHKLLWLLATSQSLIQLLFLPQFLLLLLLLSVYSGCPLLILLFYPIASWLSLFAFTFRRRQLTWTCTLQSYPSIFFPKSLNWLGFCNLYQGSTVVQFVTKLNRELLQNPSFRKDPSWTRPLKRPDLNFSGCQHLVHA